MTYNLKQNLAELQHALQKPKSHEVPKVYEAMKFK